MNAKYIYFNIYIYFKEVWAFDKLKSPLQKGALSQVE